MSLGAIPPSAGFFSKGRILVATFIHPGLVYKVMWGVATVTAFLTTLYSFRLFFIAFLGEPSEEPVSDIKPIPALMTWITLPLAILAFTAGLLNFPKVLAGSEWLSHYLATVPGAISDLAGPATIELKITIFDAALDSIALLLAWLLYGPKDAVGWRRPVVLGQQLHDFMLSGFYLDKIYSAFLVQPYRALAKILWEDVDEGGLDQGVVESSRIFPYLSLSLRYWATGRLSTYLSTLFVGLTAILCILVLLLA